MPMSRDKAEPANPGNLSTLTVTLSILGPVAGALAFAWWVEGQPPTKSTMAGNTIEVRENWQAFLAAISLCLLTVVFALLVLLQRNWRRLRLAALLGLLIGFLMGGVIASRIAMSGVMRFTPTEALIIAPPWLGGETRLKLTYSEIEWLRRRQLIRWERSWHPVRYAVAWLLGAKPGWKRFEKNEYLVKKKGEDERPIDPGLMIQNGWHEIVEAARGAGVPVKPVERIFQTLPPDETSNRVSAPSNR